MMPTKALALPPVAWECTNCAYTNKGTEPGPYSGCGAVQLIRYMIWRWQGGLLAPSTITNARVDCSLQYVLAANTNENNPVAPRRADVVDALVGSMVDVVGIHAKNRGRQCPRHNCCGSQVVVRMKLKVIKDLVGNSDFGFRFLGVAEFGIRLPISEFQKFSAKKIGKLEKHS